MTEDSATRRPRRHGGRQGRALCMHSSLRRYADHYSLLRTTQALLGLPCLAKSCERLPIVY